MTLHTYRTGDSGLPLVLLHGFPLDHRMWDEVAAALPGDRTVAAADLPGAPGNTVDLPEPSVDAAADRLAAELHDAGIERAVVAGLSMGGYVVLALMERHRALVAAAGLLDTRATPDTDQARADRLRVVAEVEASGTVDVVLPRGQGLLGETTRTARPEVGERVAGWIRDQEPAGVVWEERAMAARPDRTAVLRGYEGPVLVLVGDEDTTTPPAVADELVAAARDPWLVVVPRVGHMSAVEDPAAVAQALADLAQRADSSPAATRD